VETAERKQSAQPELQRLQLQLDARTRELQQAQEELQRFTYAASHDLRAPLRTIQANSQFLVEDCPDLPAQAAEDIRRIRRAVDRMSRLLQDLLSFSRSGSAPLRITPVDATESVYIGADELNAALREADGVLDVDPLPEVLADRNLLGQVFRALISNAIKFRAPGAPLHIRITAEDDGADCTFGVHDNGIGIDPKYADKIFEPFERLHSVSEYEGSGLGLALCRRALERMGGSIWFDSQPAGGAHFRFRLPAAQGVARSAASLEDESASAVA